jgi:ribA/ribD-fused uncharacterized protein
MTQIIDRFEDEYEFLSNFHLRPVMYRSLRWPTREHAYQAMKTTIMREQERIRLEAPTPGVAKRMGQRVTLRPNWDQRRLPFMKSILDHAFVDKSLLAQKLVNTRDAILIEGNTWGDTFWGQCGGEGENNLGILLMKRRQALIDLGMKTVKI